MMLKKLVIFDLDGVIYRGEQVLPCAPETTRLMRERGLQVRFLTNNSTRTRKHYSEKLEAMGVEASPDEIMSSALATKIHLRKLSPNGARVFLLGEDGLREELEDSFEIVGVEDRQRADYVVAGYDRTFNYEKLTHAFEALQAGAELVATNMDATFPLADGKLLPGGGTIVAAIATAWEREPYVCGKPNPLGLRVLMNAAGASPQETLLIGDRPSSEVVTGRKAGVQTCLVLTGVTTREQLCSLPEELKPDFTVNDLCELPGLECLGGSGTGSSGSTGNDENRTARD